MDSEIGLDVDEMSISSEFSIIPDCMVHGLEENTPQNHISMNASFLKNGELTVSSTSSGAVNTVLNKVQFGTLQRNKDLADGSRGLFVAVFSCNPEFVMTKSDRIAMYKVGFSSAKDFLCFVWVPVPNSKLDSLTDQSLSNKSIPVTVTFGGCCLPQDEDESYQVCYLMHNGNIAGVSVPFQLKFIETSQEEEIEKTARKVLSFRVEGLIQEQRDLRDSIQDLEIVCNNLRCENEELTENLKESQNIHHQNKTHSEELEKQVAKYQSEFDKISHEIIEKDKQLKNFQLSTVELRSELTSAEFNVNLLKERLEITEEEKKVSEDRNGVLMQDNVELKICLQHVKEDLDQALKEKEAAEKIAIDLRHRLQAADEDHELLTKSNKSLLAKLKDIQLEKSMEESLKIGGWHCVPKAKQYDDNEEGEEVESYSQSSKVDAQECALLESVASSVMASVCHSSCSQNTKELTEAFSQKMEVIVSQLTLQKMQINSLKVEIEKNRQQSRSVSVESQVTATSEIISEESNIETRNEAKGSSNTSLPGNLKEIKIVKDICSNAPDDDKKVLYSHSFLPTCCTAPVFFPYPVTKQPPRSSLPSAPPSILMGINEDHSVITTDELHQNHAVQHVEFTPSPSVVDHHSQTPSSSYLDNHNETPSPEQPVTVSSTSESLLPPPLLPETTATARNAAVLNQYINEGAMTNPFLNIQGNVGVNSQETCNISGTTTEQCTITMLSCPMCHLSFEENGIHLLQEHIDSHLERVCPVCSTAFPRSTKQEEFEVHVHSHFHEDEIQSTPSPDSSGPWGSRQNTRHSFHLLEID